MNIEQYLKEHDMTQGAFAEGVGVTQGAVWQWINGGPISAKNAMAVEKFTNGEITRRELLPEIFGDVA